MTLSNSGSSRRTFLKTSVTAGAAAAIVPALSAARVIPYAEESAAPEINPFELEETTISELQDGMQSGKFTARSLVEKYSERIAEIDKAGPSVNAIIEMNPD